MDLQALYSLTGITPEALARKLGVTSQALATSELTEEALQKLEAFHQNALASSTATPQRVGTPYVDEGVVEADSIQYLKQLPTNSVDMILSDIPYGIGQDDWDVLHDNTNSAYLGESAAQRRAGAVFKKRRKPLNGWSSADRKIPLEYYNWCSSWAGEWLRVLKPGGSAMVFAGRRLAHRCITAMEDAGFNLRDQLAWVRPKAVFRAQRLSTVFQKRGALGDAKKWEGWRVGNLRPSFEPIIWCFKPYEVTLADNVLDHSVGALNVAAYRKLTGRPDNVIQAGFAPNEAGHHEAQKPLAVLRPLIELCVPLGGMVLDPFAGSGSTAVAAIRARRRYLVIEKNAGSVTIARQRVETARPF